MRKGKAKKILALTVMVCFLSTYFCSTATALESYNTILIKEGKQLDIAETVNQLEYILKPINENETITKDDIEDMIIELTLLYEELYSFLYTPDGELLIESTNECTFILTAASLWILQAISTVISLLQYLLQVKISPPSSVVDYILTSITLVRKFIDTFVNVPIAIVNAILAFIQYLGCETHIS